MSIWSDAVAAIYADPNVGVPAVWTPAAGAPQDITLCLDRSPSAADAGGQWTARPKATPARFVRIQSLQLMALGLMTHDAALKAPAPAWQGASINFDGVARPILDKPTPGDDLTRDEWVFALG